ncbi:acyl transferase [Flavobacteriaceae bacterium]|nr:acyl transferase [Flavobacteriaceae bacterium]
MRDALLDFDTIHSDKAFESHALKLFAYQYDQNTTYRSYCDLINVHVSDVLEVTDIPFLPIQFFKTHTLNSFPSDPAIIFRSSKTTGQTASQHAVHDLTLYIKSFEKGFAHFYGNIEDYVLLALLPSYLERNDSSLVFMTDHLIKKTKRAESGFYLDDWDALRAKLDTLEKLGQKTILLGVSFALLEGAENYHWNLKNTIIMETGGMKGMRKEWVRTELHQKLQNSYGVDQIHSEYGMTELLSQAYSTSEGIFRTPPWMRVLTRSLEDPFELLLNEKTGGLNIIDLANVDSCAFIATQDLGRVYSDNRFEVLGRFDHAEIRGCNLMAL